MRILFTSIPAAGHLHPLLPLAFAAREAGHQVAFACAGSLRPVLTAQGFEVFPAGLDREGDGDPELEELRGRARQMRPGPEMDRLGIVDMIYGVRARRMLPAVQVICEHWRPELLVHDSYEAAGPTVADHLDLPHAAVEVMPLYDRRSLEHSIAGELARVRAVLGLAPDPDMLYRHLTFCFAPPGLLDPDLPRPRTLRTLRPVFFDQLGGGSLPPEVERLPEGRTAYVSIGTVANQWRIDIAELLRNIVLGLRAASLNVVVTIGRDGDPVDLGDQPSNVLVARYIPQSLMLPLADVCVTHAGFSTVMSTIAAGLPQLLVPLLVDNAFNARRCARLGLAEVIAPDELTPDRVGATVARVLDHPGYAERAREMRAQMDCLPGPDEAITLLERLAGRRG